jgi:hypothetical protein
MSSPDYAPYLFDHKKVLISPLPKIKTDFSFDELAETSGFLTIVTCYRFSLAKDSS